MGGQQKDDRRDRDRNYRGSVGKREDWRDRRGDNRTTRREREREHREIKPVIPLIAEEELRDVRRKASDNAMLWLLLHRRHKELSLLQLMEDDITEELPTILDSHTVEQYISQISAVDSYLNEKTRRKR